LAAVESVLVSAGNTQRTVLTLFSCATVSRLRSLLAVVAETAVFMLLQVADPVAVRVGVVPQRELAQQAKATMVALVVRATGLARATTAAGAVAVVAEPALQVRQAIAETTTALVTVE